MSFERIQAILVKEFKEIFRDPRMRTVIFVTPLIQIILFGYAANKDINYVPTAIFDRDNTVESREFLRSFTYSKYFVPERYIFSEKEQNRVLDRGQVNVVIHIDRGFGRDINAGKDSAVQLCERQHVRPRRVVFLDQLSSRRHHRVCPGQHHCALPGQLRAGA